MKESLRCTLLSLLFVVPIVSACAPNLKATNHTSSTASTNGQIVARKILTVPGANPNTNIYEITYMSDGIEVAAYVSEPKQPGPYPLLLDLHGGFAQPESYTHYPLPNNVSPAQVLSEMGSDKIVVYPDYRGYGDSKGTIGDLLADMHDTENAITAVSSMGNVRSNSLYMIGTSMGGGLALMLASERKDIKSVVAVSPFVGYDAEIDWQQKHPESLATFQDVALEWQSVWGKYTPGAKSYTERSPIDHVSTIQAPVLILQGTGDKNVIWQTVQEFVDKMKKNNKTVQFVLYPGGNHGLTDKYHNDVYQAELVWFTRYGLNYGL